MRLLRAELYVEFTDEIKTPSLSQRVHQAITNRAPSGYEEIAEPGVHIRARKRKMVVDWDTSCCSVIVEQIADASESIDTIISVLDKVNAVAPMNRMQNKMVITNWLLPALNYDFLSLEQKYREIMMVNQPIQEGAYDSSVILDIKARRWTLHHQSGAMRTKQLLTDFIEFKPADLPKVFLFLLASIEEQKVLQYSREEMHQFLITSFELCKSHSDIFERIWEGIL